MGLKRTGLEAKNGPKGAEAVDYNTSQILRSDAKDRQAQGGGRAGQQGS